MMNFMLDLPAVQLLEIILGMWLSLFSYAIKIMFKYVHTLFINTN